MLTAKNCFSADPKVKYMVFWDSMKQIVNEK